ncbi:MAG TPA: SMP-30/gluconolactonase/LRE family protein, partial [Ilumatobacteraceae bacterium]|nr:SMP-30/gluconolactonase/LRE family protein [Ilumatobacteraceae bacterium]
MRQRRVLLDGLRFGEGPRWHDGALWFSDMHDHRVVRMTPAGQASTVVEVTDDTPSGLGWLPDGRLLIVAMESARLLRLEPNGSLVEHANLSHLARGSLNDMIVNADGTAYVGDMGSRIQDPNSPTLPGQTLRVAPDGSVSQAADDLASPNGHALTPDGRTLIIAQSGGGELTAFDIADDGTLSGRRAYATLTGLGNYPGIADGFCLDDGGAWYADPINQRLVRVAA